MPLPALPIPATLNVVLRRGSDFRQRCTLRTSVGGTPVDLTGLTLRAKVRPDLADATAPTLTFTVSVVGAAVDGTFDILATPAQIASITTPSGVPQNVRTFDAGFWDLEITDGTLTGRFLEGSVTVSREATT